MFWITPVHFKFVYGGPVKEQLPSQILYVSKPLCVFVQLFVSIHIHECLWVFYAYGREKRNSTLQGFALVFVTTHTRMFPCAGGSTGTCVCYCDILNLSLSSSVCSSAAGACGAVHLSSWSLLLGTAMVILIGSHYQTPVGGHGSLVQSRFDGGLKWRIKKCVCVHGFYWWA